MVSDFVGKGHVEAMKLIIENQDEIYINGAIETVETLVRSGNFMDLKARQETETFQWILDNIPHEKGFKLTLVLVKATRWQERHYLDLLLRKASQKRDLFAFVLGKNCA